MNLHGVPSLTEQVWLQNSGCSRTFLPVASWSKVQGTPFT